MKQCTLESRWLADSDRRHVVISSPDSTGSEQDDRTTGRRQQSKLTATRDDGTSVLVVQTRAHTAS